MAKFFGNIRSFEDLKKQFRKLLQENHPDNGGDEETMKAINIEYEALFPIWKSRYNAAVTNESEKSTETADSTRRRFYSEFGWEGANYDPNRDVAEVAQIVRTYVKEYYPTYKFSIRISRYSMGRSLDVYLLESPERMYKTFDEVYSEWTDYGKMFNRLYANWKVDRDPEHEKRGWNIDEVRTAYDKAVAESGFYGIRTEIFDAVIKDVNALVNSYNFEDIDVMSDYYHVSFSFLGVNANSCRFVPKTARIKNKVNELAKRKKSKEKQGQDDMAKIPTLS